ncbi:predicted protein [Verticillium alfalfae VaMs.102]|uniref:Predicted protein n=1 Tax=Verticillium alfalfae (strain VaMs.102 / ATCC MYA-4576 / FGSC 10136) TaxID=526221 RepID=C9SJG9_VERA1|nr:predicted protein [Verticillium alfalfae VaMs.102]EEY18331.1 predicted protein [Verticillium alfalfae VaMs.102]
MGERFARVSRIAQLSQAVVSEGGQKVRGPTAAAEAELAGAAAARRWTPTKPTDVRPSPSASATTASQPWPRACCRTVAPRRHRHLPVVSVRANATAVATVNESVNGSETEITIAPADPRRDDDAYYDRDRRDREVPPPTKTYRRRIDSYDELPYGDERPSGSRRRRDDDDADRQDSRDSKRVKREKTPREREASPPRDVKTKSPLPPTATTAAAVTGKKEAKEDDAGVHSGSEEGEIEED